jgi:hypothetical protein
VTQSADCTDAYGYSDFAIGHFSNTDDFLSAAIEEIRGDWAWQRDQFCQGSWAYLFSSGLIGESTSIRLRGEVWGGEPI